MEETLDSFTAFHGTMDLFLIYLRGGYSIESVESCREGLVLQCQVCIHEEFDEEQTRRLIEKLKEVLAEICQTGWNLHMCNLLIRYIGLTDFWLFAKEHRMLLVDERGQWTAVYCPAQSAPLSN